MFGHPAENLIWAPNPEDSLAFTMFAMDCERKTSMVENLIADMHCHKVNKCSTFNEFIEQVCQKDSRYRDLSSCDWDRVLNTWKYM